MLTLTATSAVTPCEVSSTLFRTSGEVISDRYTECVATIPPTPSVLSTDSTTMPQKFVTYANGQMQIPPSSVASRIAGRRP